MRNPYLKKLVAFIEKVGDSERFQRLERETDEMIANAKVQIDRVFHEAVAKSDQMIHSAHAARTAFLKEWKPAEGDHIAIGEENTLESLALTDVSVTIVRSSKRASKIVVTTRDGRSVEVLHSGSASVAPAGEAGYPIKPKKRRGRS